jgi:superfamily II DNA or RNA helicase
MLKDVKWSEDGTYTPQGQHTPFEFFSSALENSFFFDIELGYFNSAAISVLAGSFATFISNGGKMRMAINQIVSADDKKAITEGLQGGVNLSLDLTDWKALRSSLDEYGEHFFKCLAFLIQEDRIELQIIKPKSTSGIAHTKKGQFVDLEGTIVGFSGSANFTLGGLFNNLEEINIFLSTSPDSVIQKKLSNQKDHFNRIMSKSEDEIEYLSPSELQEAILSTYGGQDIEDLLNVERKLKEYKKALRPKKVLIEGDEPSPEFPYSSGPREYQKQAFENWKKNNQKGLFAMATGTGKTITSLNCLLEIYKRCGYYMAIILVPTITLVNQWEDECRKFKFSRIIKVFSKNPKWKDRIELIKMEEKMRKENENPKSFIIISTYASFTREAVFELLNSFDRKKVLLIADEAHNMGSPQILKRLNKIIYLRRIGLSATPERQYEPETNDKIFSFFGAKEQFTFEYSMEDAIKNGVLCKYYYFPHMVRLTETEMDEYIDLSIRISKYFNYSKECFDKQDEVLKRLLLARKRIIHKAQNKVGVFRSIMEERFKEKGDLKYSLIYVPEGNKPDYIEDSDIFDKHEQIEDDALSDHLIDVFTQVVSDIDKYVTVKRFVSGQADRDAVLRDFASGKLQVLTSMKCLDEGVDVPRSEMAVFCASTGNPRQFIQRRGRVLRTHPDKHMAVLHDLVVIPEVGSNCDSFKMEQILLRNELIRVKNFAMLSENPSYSQIELGPVMRHYGLNLYNNDHI